MPEQLALLYEWMHILIACLILRRVPCLFGNLIEKLLVAGLLLRGLCLCLYRRGLWLGLGHLWGRHVDDGGEDWDIHRV